MSDYGPRQAVTREEFVKAWTVVNGMARQLDDLVKAHRILAMRLKQLDELVRVQAQALENLQSRNVDA